MVIFFTFRIHAIDPYRLTRMTDAQRLKDLTLEHSGERERVYWHKH